MAYALIAIRRLERRPVQKCYWHFWVLPLVNEVEAPRLAICNQPSLSKPVIPDDTSIPPEVCCVQLGDSIASCVGMYGLTSHTTHRDEQHAFGAFTSPPRASTALSPLSIKMERELGGEVTVYTTIYNTAVCILTSYN